MPDRFNATADAAIARVSVRNKGKVASGVDPADLADMAIWAPARITVGLNYHGFHQGHGQSTTGTT